MGIEFGKNDFEDDSITLGADRDHAIDYPDPVASRAEQALIDSLPREKRRQRFHSLRERPEGNEYTISGMGNLAADVTPVIGDIKAAYELPNDLSYAFELVERGYEEGDLKKMGLGGAFATLSAMGIIPGVRYGAKAGKEAIKSQLQKSADLDEDIVHEMEKGLAKAQGYDVKDYELSSYGAIVEELALIGKSNNGEILEAQIVNKLKSSIGEAPNEEVVKQFKTYLEGDAGFKIEPLVKASIKAPEGLNIKAAKKVATTGELTNAMQQLAKTQDNEITNNQISEILNKGKPNWTSADLEDSFSTMSVKNIKVVDSLKSSSQYKGQTLTQGEKDTLSAAFDDLEQTVAPKKDIFGLTPKVQDDLISDFEMLGNSQNQIVTNKQIKDIIEIKTGFTPNVQTTNEIQAALNDKGISTINSFDQFKKLTGQDVQEHTIVETEFAKQSVPKPKTTMSDSTVNIIDSTAVKQSNEITKAQLSDIALKEFKATSGLLLDAEREELYGYLENKGIKLVDKVSGKEALRQLVGGTFAKADVDMTPDQKFIVDRIRSNLTTTRNLSDTYGQGSLAPNVAEGMHNIKIKGKLYNVKNKADQIELVKMLPKSIRRTVIEEMNRPMPKIFHGSAGISQPYGRGTAYADMTRAEVLEKEGFMPFTDFEEGVEIGLGGSKGATGIHMELGKKMLSTSRDPLVSIKRGFGANIPANVVSAPLPRSQVRPMKPEEYDISKSKAQYSRDDTATSLPMHRHKEAEIALSRPEDIESIRQLSRQEDPIRKTEPVDRKDLKNLGKMSLEDRVITGQRFANSITNKFDVLEALIPDDRFDNYISKMQEGNLKPRQSLVAYNEVRDIMKDLKTLGQFTEQYGARGTYDSLYKTFRAKNRERVKFIAESLPEGEKKNLLTSLHKVMDDYGAYNTGATGKKVLRKKSDKEILNALKSDDVADALTKLEGYPDNRFSEDDLKRMTFLLTDRMNRGGLMARR